MKKSSQGMERRTGGLGIVDNTSDQVVEKSDEGYDTVQSSVTYKIGNNIERLILTSTNDINGTGNATGCAIIGNDGNNILTGGESTDYLYGGAGNDTLNGGAGTDVMDVLFWRSKCQAANDTEGRVAA
jgi:Ca2+-binding RTX toxin-like protein